MSVESAGLVRWQAANWQRAVIDVATGERSAVEDGVVRLPLEADATPLFFPPD